MSDKSIHIVHLYPKEMNIYGDTGNTLVLSKRLEWRGINVKVSLIGVGDTVPEDADIILGGGGQDSGQSKIQADLQEKADSLHKLASDGVAMLMICGMYQLFGRSFTTAEGVIIKGIGILPIETTAGPMRHIGNTLYETQFGEVAGYENHSGVTILDDVTEQFAAVTKGAGNNGQDKSEGCQVKNVIGMYSHGPVLCKNPQLADGLILFALKKKYGVNELSRLDDELEHKAHEFAKQRPR